MGFGIGSIIGRIIAGDTGAAIGGQFDANKAAKADRAANNSQQVRLWEQQLPALVKGAKAAGLSPLVAAGINPAAASPVVGQVGALTDMGQNISRAAMATATSTDRAITHQTESLMLEKMALENELLRSQITSVNRSMNPPGPVTNVPFQQTMFTDAAPYAEPGTVSDVGFVRTSGGGLAKVPSMEAKNRIEDMILPELEWFMRNRLNPFTAGRSDPNGLVPPPPGRKGWRWSHWRQEYIPFGRR